jgi:hypothetical protein
MGRYEMAISIHGLAALLAQQLTLLLKQEHLLAWVAGSFGTKFALVTVYEPITELRITSS